MAKKRLRAEEPDKLTPAQEKALIDSYMAVVAELKKDARKKARGKKPKEADRSKSAKPPLSGSPPPGKSADERPRKKQAP